MIKIGTLLSLGLFLFLFLPSTAEAAIQLVGTTTATSGAGSAYAMSLTSLSGGLSSAPITGDLVVVVNSYSGTSNGNPGVDTSGYTEVYDLANTGDTNDINLSVNYKIMGSTPDTSVTCSTSGNSGFGSACMAYVWRGVNPTTPMDVATTSLSTTAIDDDDPDCVSVTPATSGAVIMCIGGAAGGTTAASNPTFPSTPTGVTGGTYVTLADTRSPFASAVYYLWTSGAINIGAWTVSMGTESANSQASGVIVLRPITAPVLLTGHASNIGATSATLFGELTNTGSSNPTQSGFAYSTSNTFASAATTTEGSMSSLGPITSTVTGLSTNTVYYYRAYATNSSGTAYGSTQSFTAGVSTSNRTLRLFGGVSSGTILKIFGSQSTVARTAKTVTAVGNAQVDTAQSQFGGASALFDGTGDYLSSASNADWNLGGTGGGNDFTIDFWFRKNAVGSTGFITAENSGATTGWNWRYSDSSVAIQLFEGSTQRGSLSWNPTLNTWYHIAFVRSGTTITAYVNGSSIGTYTNMDFNNDSNALIVGAEAAGTAGVLNGWMDEVRITKGLARWTGNFTPPSAPYTSDSSTVLLLHMDGADASTSFTDDVADGSLNRNIVIYPQQ